MDIEVASVIDLPDVQLTVLQRLDSDDGKTRYRVETSQREQFLLQVYSESDWTEFEQEHKCLSILGPHDNFLSLSRAAVVPGPPRTGLLLYDCMPIGSLGKLCAQVEELAEQQVLNYAKELTKGIAFMHSKGIIHGNIGLGCVWVGSDFRCKLAGLGKAVIGMEMETGSRREWQTNAPECMQTLSPRPSVDIWALGCLIYELLYRDIPFPPSYSLSHQVIAEWKPQSKPIASDWDYLFSRLFMVDPNARAGAREILDSLAAFKLEKRSIGGDIYTTPDGNPIGSARRKDSWMGNSTKSWVQSLTLDDTSPPDKECMRKLLAKAWNKPQKIVKFFSAFQRLTFTRTITAIKSMLVLHGYIQQGPIALVTIHMEAVRKVVERCEAVWTPSVRINLDGNYTEYIAGLIRQFLKLIHRKLELHTLSKSMGSWQNADLSTYSLCSQALAYWTDSLLLASRLFIGGKDLVELRLAWMVQVMEDVLGLYTSLCRNLPSVLSMTDDPSLKAVLILKFQSNYAKLTSLGKGLHRQRPGIKMVELPDTHPEEINRLMSTVPEGAQTVDIFLTENEYPQTDQWRSSTIQFTTLKAINLDTPSSRTRAATEGTETLRKPSPMKQPTPVPIIDEQPESHEGEPESPHCLDMRLRGLLSESPAWLILMDELQFREVLSMGIYFTIYKGEYRKTPVAISVLRSFVQKPQFASMVDFISLMSRVTHPNLVLFMGASVGRQIAIVTELTMGGSLYELLHERTDLCIKTEMKYAVLGDVARAIHALHSHNPPLPHGELASSKVLIVDEVTKQSSRICTKVSEFGIRMFLDPGSGASQLGYWSAPEVTEGREVTPAGDIFSFGILMLEVLMRKIPTEVDISDKAIANGLPANVSSLLIHCLERNPALRPTAQMVLDVFESLSI